MTGIQFEVLLGVSVPNTETVQSGHGLANAEMTHAGNARVAEEADSLRKIPSYNATGLMSLLHLAYLFCFSRQLFRR